MKNKRVLKTQICVTRPQCVKIVASSWCFHLQTKQFAHKFCHFIFNRYITLTKSANFPTSTAGHYKNTLKYVALVSLSPRHVAHALFCCYSETAGNYKFGNLRGLQ